MPGGANAAVRQVAIWGTIGAFSPAHAPDPRSRLPIAIMSKLKSASLPASAQDGDSLIHYPCDFPIKVMGRNADGFADAVAAVVLKHAPDFDPSSMELRPSSGRNYLSCTCTIRATSRAQLDALYMALTSHPMVAVVL